MPFSKGFAVNLVYSHSSRVLLLLTLTTLVYGCASNPYRKFYTSTTDGKAASEMPNLIAHTGEPQVYGGNADNPEEDNIRMFENGYVPLGFASFSGPPKDRVYVMARARQLKAAIVIVYTSNPQTITKTVPVNNMFSTFAQTLSDELSENNQTTTQTSGTIYGNGGSVNYTERSTTTTPPKPQTPQYRQQTSTLYDQAATFWVKSQPSRLGIWMRDLTHKERMELGGNKGVAVRAVEGIHPGSRRQAPPQTASQRGQEGTDRIARRGKRLRSKEKIRKLLEFYSSGVPGIPVDPRSLLGRVLWNSFFVSNKHGRSNDLLVFLRGDFVELHTKQSFSVAWLPGLAILSAHHPDINLCPGI